MTASSLVLLAALQMGEPFAIRLHAPVDEPGPVASPSPSAPASSEALALAGPLSYEGDAIPGPEDASPTTTPSERKLGTNTTLFLNFDGVHIEACSPSDSHRNCHWLERYTTFDPWSGSLADRVAILDVIRSLTADFGIRVTGQRPPADEPYTMVVYGGDSVAEDALGRAPSGDCWNDLPNEIAYAYMDASRATWINGGASTALHEAAHTWGFDHVGLEGTLMAPSGGNSASAPFDGCGRVVADVALTPSDEPSCPSVNLELCGLSGYQHDAALLRMLFGPPYVDERAPEPILIAPFDGIYYQGPADFQVDIEILDDLDPQRYQVAVIVPGLAEEPHYTSALTADFSVDALPLGTWTFEVRVRDEAGNEGSLSFVVEVGEDPPRLDDGYDCQVAPTRTGAGLLALLFVPLVLRRPGRRKQPDPRRLSE